MKPKLKNTVIAASILIALGLFLLYDYHRVQHDFKGLKAYIMRVRLQSVTEGKPMVVQFINTKVSVLEFPKEALLETRQFGTIYKVRYDTTLGEDMIVFFQGTTSMHNKYIHGGDIALRSWFGFKKFIHVNCAGLAEEGRYPGTIGK